MGWKEELTPAESKAVEQFKKRMETEVTPKMLADDSLFYRFMKVRDFNLKNAEDLLRKNIAFRKEFRVDTILTDYHPPEVLTKYSPLTIIGFDKEGCPVKYIDVGSADFRGTLESSKKIDFCKFNIQEFEKDVELMQEQSRKLGKSITKMSFILNFDGMTFAKATHKKSIECMLQGIKKYQDNYPERIKSIYIINASLYFTILFSLLEIVVDAVIMKRIHRYGTEGWKAALLELMDSDQLPAFLGGNKTDTNGDPFCKSYIKFGEKVPESCYLRQSEKKLSTVPGVKKLSVARFAKTQVKFEVLEKDSILEWEFETKRRDIGFGVYFKENSSDYAKPVEIVPQQRIDTSFETETGLYRCGNVGTYIIVFDNTYSWIYSKEIYYKARIVTPREQEARQMK